MTKNPRLDELKRDGSMIGQPPFDFGKVPPVGKKADAQAILRTKKPKLKRKYVQQRINSGKISGSEYMELKQIVARPEKRKR